MQRQESSSPGIRLVISDPTRLGCALLRDALERKHFEVLAALSTQDELMAAVERLAPDVILINVKLLQVPLPQLLEQIRDLQPDAKCILISQDLDRESVIGALRAGVRGVFSSANEPEQLFRCIRAIHEGQYWLNSSELSLVMDALSEASLPQITDCQGQIILTPRENDVVALVAEGLTNRDVSKHLRISEHTVKNYLFRIFDKLGISSRSELILYALSQKNKRPKELKRMHIA